MCQLLWNMLSHVLFTSYNNPKRLISLFPFSWQYKPDLPDWKAPASGWRRERRLSSVRVFWIVLSCPVFKTATLLNLDFTSSCQLLSENTDMYSLEGSPLGRPSALEEIRFVALFLFVHPSTNLYRTVMCNLLI